MHQIKLFCGIEGGTSRLESEVNSWLRDTKPKAIVNVFGNMSPQAVLPQGEAKKIAQEGGSRRFAPSDIFLCIVYEA
jgi:hypothetical protein